MFQKQKMIDKFEVLNVELFNKLHDRRMFNSAIDEMTKFTENSAEYVQEERVTYKKALIRDATRVYRRERDLLNEEIELIRNEQFVLRERISL